MAADPGWRHLQHHQPQRLCLAGNAGAGQGELPPFARAVFEIYWGEDKDISQDAVLAEVCQRVGVDPQKFLAGIGEQAIKDQLKAMK